MSIPLTQERKNIFMKHPQKYLKSFKIRIIKMIHLKWAEKQKGSIKTIIDNEILAPKDA